MGLRLNTVRPIQGWLWIRDAFALWRARPIGFMGLFTFFLLTVLLLAMLVPVVGGVLGLVMLPMLTLGFLIACKAQLAGQPVHPLHFFEGLRHPDPVRRRAQWLLCASFAALTTAVMLLAHAVDDGLFEAWQQALATSQGSRSPEIDKIMADPRLAQGIVVRFGGAALLALPYWHAAALVHWGGQGAAQALFSSTLALWRARGAFVVYLLGWLGVAAALGAGLTVLATLLQMPGLLGALVVPLGLVVSTVFYVSLWFCWRDSFRDDADMAPRDTAAEPRA